MVLMAESNFFFPAIFVLPLLLIILKHFKSSPSPLPPGPSSWSMISNVLLMRTKPHITLTQLAKTYGPLFSIRIGTQLVVVGSSQEAAMEILRTHDRVLSGRSVLHAAPSKIMKLDDSSLGWIDECNDKWKHLRTICKTELFSGKALESQAGDRDKMVKDMVEFIRKMEGKVVNIRQVAFAAIFNMLGNVMASRDVISLEHESVEGEISRPLKEAGTALNVSVSDFFPILARFDLESSQRKGREWFENICMIWEDIINERREKIKGDASPCPRDFLSALINNGSRNGEINILLQEMFISGADSSSSTIEWMMAELIKNPKCMKKVQEEIKRETRNGEDTIQESHLPQLTYLQACFKETLRLHPPGPLLLPRRAVESCQVMNYTIPKNAKVSVNFWAIGRDPKIWEDPLVFKPERFLNSSLDYKGNDFDYIPFGSGRRICPGLPMAAKQVPLVVAYFVHFFDWSLPNGESPDHMGMSDKYSVVLLKEQSLLLVPEAKK